MYNTNKITTGIITKLIKNNNQTIDINLETDPEFEQSLEFKTFNRKIIDIENATVTNPIQNVDMNDDIINKENSIINIPKKINDIFDNLISDDYYLYGVSKTNSFLMSVLYILSPDFKFKNKDKQTFIKILIDNLEKELPQYYKEGNYTSFNINKNKVIQNLKNNIIDSSVLYYISDYYNSNIIVIDYHNMKYLTGKQYNMEKKNIIIINNENDYIPLIQMYGEFPTNIIYKLVINKLELKNKLDILYKPEYGSIDIQSQTSTQTNIVENLPINPKKNKLKAMSSYKLNELQKLAEENGSSIKHKITNKNKTKKQLYDSIYKLINK